ncbi:MAG: hypothetical protein ABIH03_14955 [Pseudomonadota bacterium]
MNDMVPAADIFGPPTHRPLLARADDIVAVEYRRAHARREDHLPADPTATTTPARLSFTSARDLIESPRPVEIIEGIAWAGCLSVLVSESASALARIDPGLLAQSGPPLSSH